MGETSIPCREATRNRLRDDKATGVSWDRYLNDLLDAAEVAENAAVDNESIAEELRTVQNRLDELPEETARKTEERVTR